MSMNPLLVANPPPCIRGHALPPVRWLFELHCARVLRAGRIQRTSQTHPHASPRSTQYSVRIRTVYCCSTTAVEAHT